MTITSTIINMKQMHDLDGRSFTDGLALYHAITERRLDGDEEAEIFNYMTDYIGSDVIEMLEARGLHCSEPAEVVEMFDLSRLDQIAEDIMDTEADEEDREEGEE